MPFDAFISYSQAADGRLAPAVQQGLQRLARVWHKRRALHVFRDDTGLSATPDLWASIEKALDDSRFFIVLASPQAAASQWVAREIEHWRAARHEGTILIALTGGDWSWDAAAHDFDWDRSPAIPRALQGAFSDEPKITDLRWARDEIDLDLRNARFRRSLADLAAPLHGVSPEDIEGEDIRQHRRFRRIVRATIAVLAALVLLASIAAVLALRSRDQARARERVALGRGLIGISDQSDSLRLKALLALEAFRLESGSIERAALLQAWPVTSAQAVFSGSSGASTQVAFIADRRLVSASVDGSLRLWDIATQTPRGAPIPGHANVFALAPKHGGIVVGGSDGTVEFALDGHDVKRAGHVTSVNAVAVSPDQRIAATAGSDGRVRFWSLPSGRASGEAIAAPGSTAAIAFDRSGRVLYSVGSAGALRRWSVARQSEIGHAVRVSPFALSAVAVDPVSGQIAVGGGAREVYFLGAGADRAGSPALTAGGGVRALAYSSDGRYLAVGETFGLAEIWTAVGHVPVNPPLAGHTGVVTSVAFSRDDKLLATAGDDGTVRTWRIAAPAMAVVSAHAGDIIWGIALDGAGRRVADASFDGSVRMWRARGSHEPDVVLRRPRAGNAAFSVAFDDPLGLLVDGLTETVSSGRADYVVEAWDVSGTPVLRWRRTLRTDAPGDVVRVAVSPDGAVIAATASTDGVALLDAGTGRLRRTIATGSQVLALAFARDGLTLATSHRDEHVRIWSVRNGARKQVLGGPTGLSFALAFSTAGDLLASADQGGRVSLWQLADGRWIPKSLLARHSGAIESVVFSPDGTILAGTGADGTLVLWDVESGGRFAELTSGGAEAPSIAWAGTTLVTGHDRGLVASWSPILSGIGLSQTAEALCRYARPALTRAEWRTFLPGHAYGPICR